MTPQQFERVESLFEQACAQPAAEREAWLVAACRDDEVVRQKVCGMLRADVQTAAGLDQPALGADFHVGDFDAAETRLRAEFAESGRYRITSLLGEGGFGRVYRAEQLQPVRRDVALKVVKLGMDTRRVLARFEAERQTLALMNHPGIARVLDAGATPSGRSYFSMELVDGRPITRYSDEQGLDARARVRLFVSVCEAVRHAHQRGVLHRDLKPSNVLIATRDGAAAPAIIDFGIARAMSDDVRGATLLTEQGHMVGTPEYMSPEQAMGDPDIDTRTDIYSLGVMLYELLTGAPPIERQVITASGLQELRRLICDVEPPRPSARVSREARTGAARGRGAAPGTLQRELRGDLDWIVMKALEKDRSRRYETVNAFADDLRRFLNNETVLARPPTASYRFMKFARRHRGALVAGSAMVLLLVGGVIGTTIGLLRAQREAQVARAESAVARAVSDFLNNDMFAAFSPDELGNDVSMRRVVEAAAARVQEKFVGQPLPEAAVQLQLGRTFSKLGDFVSAERHLARADELRRSVLGPEALETLEVEYELGVLCAQRDRNADAEVLLRRVYEGRLVAYGESHPDTIAALYQLAVSLGEQGDLPQTETLMLRALDLCRRHLGPRHPQTLTVVMGMGILHVASRKLDLAREEFTDALRLSRETLGADHPSTLLAMVNLAHVQNNSGHPQEAEQLLAEALTLSKRRRGEAHPATLIIMCNLASAWRGSDRAGESESLYKTALASAEKSLPEGHTVTATVRAEYAAMLDAQKRFDEAEPLFLACVTGFQKNLGLNHPATRAATSELIAHYQAANQPEKAARWRQELAGQPANSDSADR